MASDVALSLAQRTTLIALQEIERDSAVAQRRLSYGRRIIDVTDDPAQFFQARGLSLRIENLLQRRAQIDQGVSNLQAQLNGLTGLRGFLNQAIGIVDQAQASNTDVDQLGNLTTLFDQTIEQFRQLAEDVSYSGLNLITSTSQSLTVNFSDRNEARLEVKGVNILGERVQQLDSDFKFQHSLNTLGLFSGIQYRNAKGGTLKVSALFAENRKVDERFSVLAGYLRSAIELGADNKEDPMDTGENADIDADKAFGTGFSIFANGQNTSIATRLRANLARAVDRIEQIENYFANNVAILQNRLSFTTAYSNTLTIGRDKIVVADVNEEAANLIALRTRSQIGIGALAANASTEQQLLLLLQQ